MSNAAPLPAIALPRMNVAELGAAAHNVEPAGEIQHTLLAKRLNVAPSKTKMALRYTIFGSNHLKIVPPAGWSAVIVIRYAEPYQPTSSRASNCDEIFGIATEIIVVSIATRKVPKKSEHRMITSLHPVGYS